MSIKRLCFNLNTVLYVNEFSNGLNLNSLHPHHFSLQTAIYDKFLEVQIISVQIMFHTVIEPETQLRKELIHDDTPNNAPQV